MSRGSSFAACLLAAACVVGLGSSAVVGDSAGARATGTVFTDRDGDGKRGPDEPGRAGVSVSNGREVVESDAAGAFSIPIREPGFVTVTCPADSRCPVWHHPADASRFDFALAPREPEDDLFFIHLSDAHVFPTVEDLRPLIGDGLDRWWLPRIVSGWVLLYTLDDNYPDRSRTEIVATLREIVGRHRNIADSWDGEVMMDYVDLVLDPESGVIDPVVEIPQALGEATGLAPRFVVHTGDMIFEGNNGDPEAVDRWFGYYRQLVAEEPMRFYDTIGNNEIAGSDRSDFTPADPGYGKGLYRKHLGPTRYSFERGPFHFAALDSHRPEFDTAEPGADGDWTFYEMSESVRDWLDADLRLARARGKTLVVLNHEPLFYDPSWGFDDPHRVDADALLEEHGVAYTLSGHIHRNGFQDAPPEGGTTHINTGALSGFRWLLPASIHSRGYRLVYAQGDRLYTAWKEIDRPLLGFVSPRAAEDEPDLHVASTHAQPARAVRGELEVVGVGVDVDQPFGSLSLWLDGEPLETEAWGSYFVRATVDTSRIRRSGRLELRAVDADGSEQVARVELVPAESAEGAR